jgi:LCP family protein required for cell wall assembly
MADGEKPYRVYRGGRVKGKVPTLPRPSGRPAPPEEPPRYSGPGPVRRRPRRRRLGFWFAIVFALFLAWLTAWVLASYFTFRDGVSAANKRLPPRVKKVLVHQDGLLMFHSTTILLLGTDRGPGRGRSGDRHSDSVMLVRTDPGHHRLYYLSIPRDLRTEIPGHGTDKVAVANQIGGPTLTVLTVRKLTGLDVNHVVIVDFSQFKKLIDAIGGITIDVPERIISKFDCPYTAARCQSWPGWRFGKGKQHMDGRRALIYSRVRKNSLNPADNDFTRSERQQQVIQATLGKLASVGTFFDLPFIGDKLLRPVATDLSPGQFAQLGWDKWRSGNGNSVHCRLGGEISDVGGESVIEPTEENHNVIAMFTGDSAPQPPLPGSGAYGPGCVVGKTTIGSR